MGNELDVVFLVLGTGWCTVELMICCSISYYVECCRLNQGIIPTSLTVPGGSAFFTSSFDSENAYFQPDILQERRSHLPVDRTGDHGCDQLEDTITERQDYESRTRTSYLPLSRCQHPMGCRALTDTSATPSTRSDGARRANIKPGPGGWLDESQV